ncbi:stabilizer of axonemal microtubules 2 [Notothenia coriiceps]|uniref:Stabilizer of axonemal microtubules 2 n=1 Tax=Notothenia coriiceps TaxID=8208 RepID=A0A6I9PY58_9TELE|nr:PREDICTED: uncharacterized protein LOC104965595 [Notothenia coriiceps]
MHPQNMREQNGKPPATSVRKPLGERAHKRISMSTEYQEKFLPPRCHAAMVTSAPQKAPYHTLKGTSSDKGSLIRVYVTHKYTHHPPEAPQQSLPPKVQRRCSSAPQNPARSIANQVAAMFYTSVYKDDFQAWKVIKRQPYKLTDSLKVKQGLVAPISTSKQSPFQKVHVGANCKAVPKELEPQPIESITSYRSDYVAHPVQPRKRREQPVQQNKGLPLQAAVPLYRELFDAAHKSFENGSPETQFQGRGKAKESIPSADVNQFISTTHTDFPAHKCQRTKPILPMEHRERVNEPLESTTTMREAYKAWDTPRCRPEQARPKKTTFSLITHQPIESCNTNQKPFSLNPKVSDTEGGKSTEKPPRSAEDGGSPSLDRTSPDNEESRTYQKSFGDKAVNWFDGGICEESPEESSEEHHIYSYMVSTKS